MIFAALNEAAERGELLLVQDGLCRFHKRRDDAVCIREILVLPSRRRAGVGRRLVGQIRAMYPNCQLVARCPAHYEANGFWRTLGFELRHTVNGVNVWSLLPSSTVPTATRPLPGSP